MQAIEMPTAPTQTVRPRKAVQSVPLSDRSTVELVMALTNLAAHSVGPLVRTRHGSCLLPLATHACPITHRSAKVAVHFEIASDLALGMCDYQC